MAKQLLFSEEARRSLKRGIDVLANAVVTTLGPKGRNVALDKKWGAPTITHDGVTVAKEIELEDPFENMGAQLLKEAATKTNDIAGDGTTTATLLAHTIITEGMKNVAAGANPMLLKRGILAGTEAIVNAIADQAIELETKEEIANVAAISAQDREIGTWGLDLMRNGFHIFILSDRRKTDFMKVILMKNCQLFWASGRTSANLIAMATLLIRCIQISN